MSGATKYHTGKFPPKNLQLERLVPLIGEASAAVARYDGMLQSIPNSRVLISPLTTQEAVLSSAIEGTQATMGEVLEFEAGGDAPAQDEHRKNDIYEVLNYRAAISAAEDAMETVPSPSVCCFKLTSCFYGA
jgi:Fic family protein